MNEIKSQPIELIDTGAIVAKYQPAEKNDIVVISFHHITKGSRAIWGGEFFRKNGISVIGITDYKMTWYPSSHMAAVVPHILSLLSRYKKIVAYGHSMGAYAAMKYGRELGIDLALAFAPQHSIEPVDVRKFDKGRADLYYRPDLHKGMKIVTDDLPTLTLVFLDWRFRVDRRHAARLPLTPRIDYVACPFVKHQPVEMLSKAKATKALFDLVRVDQADWRTMRRLVRNARRTSPMYEENLNLYLKGRTSGIDVGSIIQELENATGPSLAIDKKIAWTMGIRPNGASAALIPPYTNSIDQAANLVTSIAPSYALDLTIGGSSQARIGEGPWCSAPTPPLAICLAAMKLKLYRFRRRRRKEPSASAALPMSTTNSSGE